MIYIFVIFRKKFIKVKKWKIEQEDEGYIKFWICFLNKLVKDLFQTQHIFSLMSNVKEKKNAALLI